MEFNNGSAPPRCKKCGCEDFLSVFDEYENFRGEIAGFENEDEYDPMLFDEYDPMLFDE